MQIKSENKQAFKKSWNYAENLATLLARDTRNLRKNNDVINDNKAQLQ